MSTNSKSWRHRFVASFARAFGICIVGSFFVAYGLSWYDFVQNGEVDFSSLDSVITVALEAVPYTFGVIAYGWWALFLPASFAIAFWAALFSGEPRNGHSDS